MVDPTWSTVGNRVKHIFMWNRVKRSSSCERSSQTKSTFEKLYYKSIETSSVANGACSLPFHGLENCRHKWTFQNPTRQWSQSVAFWPCDSLISIDQTPLNSRRFWNGRHKMPEYHPGTDIEIPSVFWPFGKLGWVSGKWVRLVVLIPKLAVEDVMIVILMVTITGKKDNQIALKSSSTKT